MKIRLKVVARPRGARGRAPSPYLKPDHTLGHDLLSLCGIRITRESVVKAAGSSEQRGSRPMLDLAFRLILPERFWRLPGTWQQETFLS